LVFSASPVTESATLAIPEVDQRHVLVAVGQRLNENVLGLEIAMDDALAVGRIEGRSDPAQQPQRPRGGYAARLDRFAERPPLDVALHHKGLARRGDAAIEDRNDTRVLDPGERLHLLRELARGPFRLRDTFEEHLHDDEPLQQALVLRQIHGPEAAAAEFADDAVAIPEPLANHVRPPVRSFVMAPSSWHLMDRRYLEAHW
jgi:hypothetical protein